MKYRLKPVRDERDIPEVYRDTPIEKLLLYHNMGHPGGSTESAELLILMCMDGRQTLRLPKNFSFVVRNSGARLHGVSFSVSFAIGSGGIQHMAVIGHSDCRMVDLESRRGEFVTGLSERGGWERTEAEKHFVDLYPCFDKEDGSGSVISEVGVIRAMYPGIVAAPIFYSLEDDDLYLIEE